VSLLFPPLFPPGEGRVFRRRSGSSFLFFDQRRRSHALHLLAGRRKWSRPSTTKDFPPSLFPPPLPGSKARPFSWRRGAEASRKSSPHVAISSKTPPSLFFPSPPSRRGTFPLEFRQSLTLHELNQGLPFLFPPLRKQTSFPLSYRRCNDS